MFGHLTKLQYGRDQPQDPYLRVSAKNEQLKIHFPTFGNSLADCHAAIRYVQQM